MSNFLHVWGVQDKKNLIKNAYDALPSGGAFISVETIIDKERKTNIKALMMSLNMMIETHEGFELSEDVLENWAKEIGFKSVEFIPLANDSTAAILYKA